MSEIDDLNTLLAEERDALRAGRIERLEELAGRKARLADALQAQAPAFGHAAIAALQADVRRNASMLEAAQDGLKAAIQRTEARRRAASMLETYGADGRRTEFLSTGPRHSRRA